MDGTTINLLCIRALTMVRHRSVALRNVNRFNESRRELVLGGYALFNGIAS